MQFAERGGLVKMQGCNRDVIHAVAGKTADIGSSFYFQPETVASARELGLDGFRFYFLGRGGVLGDVDADVVHSAFGYFHPSVVARMWDSAMDAPITCDAA